MKRPIFSRLLALLLCLAMLVPYLDSLPLKAWAQEGASGSVSETPLAVVAAGSDFQYLSETNSYNGVDYDTIYEANGQLLKDILIQMKADHPSLDGYFMCGDYDGDDYVYQTSIDGIAAAYGALNEVYGLTHNQIQFVQGNHDPADAVGLDATGSYDTTYYGVYQINEDDFPWGSNSATTANAAAGLKTYLDKKVGEQYAKPIFVITHLPLHHTYRMNGNRTDNSYARYLVDVLNEAGAAGLNIVFMFGHNHSGAYDAYLGRDCVYMLPGTSIPVTDPETGTADAYDNITLNFTYMNPGYVGYSADELSSTVFEIYEDRMVATRYSSSGIIPLKKAGYSSGNSNESWLPDTTVVESPYSQNLSKMQVSIVSNTMGTTIAPGATAQIQLGVESASPYSVTWEILGRELITLTPDAADPTLATITGVEYGTTTIKATVRNTADPTAVPATLRLDVTVAPEGAVKFNDRDASNLYRLVTDWSTLSANKRYMILNRDTAGFAVAMAGPDTASDRDRVDPATVLTKPTVFALSGDEGLYTVPINGHDIWELRMHSSDPVYHLRQISNAAGYIAAAKAVDTALDYSYTCGYRFASGYSSGGSVRWAIDSENEAFNLHSYYKSSVVTEPAAAYGLYYDSTGEYFKIRSTGSPVYVYEWAGSSGPEMWMWLTSDSGTIVIDGDEVTGAKVAVMVDGQVTEVPITLDMLDISPVQLLTAGKHTCSVVYDGVVITDNYVIEMTSDAGAAATEPVEVTKNWKFFQRVTATNDFAAGGVYVLADTDKEENAHILTALETADGAQVTAGKSVVLDYNGSQYVAVRDDSWLWEAVKHTDGLSLQHQSSGKYLGGTSQYELVLRDTPSGTYGWRYSSTLNVATTSTSIPEGATHAMSSDIVFENGKFLLKVRNSSNVDLHVYPYQPSEAVQTVVVYADALEGQCPGGSSGSQSVGGNIVISSLVDGVTDQRQVPITLDMLGLTAEQRLIPGSYTCSLFYQGEILSEDYQITILPTQGENEPAAPVVTLISADDLVFRSTTYTWEEGKRYIFVNSKVEGPGSAVGMKVVNGEKVVTAHAGAVFTIEGSEYTYFAIKDPDLVWNAQATVTTTQGNTVTALDTLFVRHEQSGDYLFVDEGMNLRVVDVDTVAALPNGWRSSGGNFVTGDDSMLPYAELCRQGDIFVCQRSLRQTRFGPYLYAGRKHQHPAGLCGCHHRQLPGR